MLFVDTGAWFARFVPTDPNHQRIKACLDANRQPLITTDYCVDETLTLLVARRRVRLAREAAGLLFDGGGTRLHFLTPDEICRAAILFQAQASAGWSFTDCTSKVVIDELKITMGVALDAHFRQFGIAVVP